MTAAALIMASVFGSFILGGDPTIKSIGFALAFGVLVDAFVVRMTIVPAVMALVGERVVPASLARPDPAERRHRGVGAAQAHVPWLGQWRENGGACRRVRASGS